MQQKVSVRLVDANGTCSPAVAFVPLSFAPQFVSQKFAYRDAGLVMVNTCLAVPVRALSPFPPRCTEKEGFTLEEVHA